MPKKYRGRSVFTAEEFAKMLQVSTRTVERRIERGLVPIVDKTITGCVRIPRWYVEKILGQITTENDSERHI